MKNFSCYTTRTDHVLSKQLQLLWRSAMVMLAVFLIAATGNYAVAQKTGFGGVSFSQYANEPTQEMWINGILNPNNSEYFEGTATLQRVVLVNIPTTPSNQHSFYFKVLATKGGIHAYDFLTSFDQAVQDYSTVTGGTKDLLAGKTLREVILLGSIPNPATSSMIADLLDANHLEASAPSAAAHAMTPMNPLDARNVSDVVANYDLLNGGAESRKIDLYGSSPISSATLNFLGYSSSSSDTYALYRLDWTSPSSNMLILMAGHLSIGDVTGLSSLSYGPGRGSSSISGGPYHFKLENLDGISLGNQDNQIQAGAITVFINPECRVTGGTDVCLGGSTTFTANIEPTTVDWDYSWSIITGTGTVVGSSSEQTFTVTPTSLGTFTVQVNITTTEEGYNPSSCTQSITVVAQPTAVINSADDQCLATGGNTFNMSGTYSGGTPTLSFLNSTFATDPNLGSVTANADGTWSATVTTTGVGEAEIKVTTTNSSTTTTGCTPATATELIKVVAQPTAVINSADDQCLDESGNTFSLSGTYSGGMPVLSIENSTFGSPPSIDVFTPASDGTWTATISTSGLGEADVKVTTTNSSTTTTGCTPATASEQIKVSQNPTLTFTTVNPSCSSITGTITVTSPLDGNGADYEYSYNGADYVDEITFEFNAGAGFSLKARNKATLCEAVFTCDRDPRYVEPTSDLASGATLSAKAVNPEKAVEREAEDMTAYPVPFSERATVEFRTNNTEQYTLGLYDMKGVLVKVLKSGTAVAGELQQVEVDGRSLAEGLYIVRMTRDSGAESVKLLLKRK